MAGPIAAEALSSHCLEGGAVKMLDPTAAVLNAQKKARTDAVNAIINSPAVKRLVVAGPGAGKTYTFRRAFAKVGDSGLALTFIRALEDDLRRSLPAAVQVNTLHAYAKHLFHQLHGSEPFMYPPLPRLVARDLQLAGRAVAEADLDEAFHELDDSNGLITDAVARGDYYGAVSYDDIVFRALRGLQAHPEHIEIFPLIVVDEYQDFNRLETEFIALLATVNHVLVAGDDDQALYVLKHASPDFLRAMANGGTFQRFELPFCSRCTAVIVGAVNDIVAAALKRGLLQDRIAKPFECYLPEKLADSKAFPRLIVARCSVDMTNARYMGRYVLEQIEQIGKDDIEESRKAAYPTVLVIAPRPFLEAACEVIRQTYPHAELRMSSQPEPDSLEGYRRLLLDARSRLGWRILIHAFPFADSDSVLEGVIASGTELADAIPAAYRDKHLAVAKLLKKVIERAALDSKEADRLEQAAGLTLDQIRAKVAPEDHAEPGPPPLPGPADEPWIVCTTLVGAKGLSAPHVFIVGLMNGHFPKDPHNVTNDEVCRLIVALSRTRKQCHLVFCQRYAGVAKQPSEFFQWIDQEFELRDIDKAYWKNH